MNQETRDMIRVLGEQIPTASTAAAELAARARVLDQALRKAQEQWGPAVEGVGDAEEKFRRVVNRMLELMDGLSSSMATASNLLEAYHGGISVLAEMMAAPAPEE